RTFRPRQPRSSPTTMRPPSPTRSAGPNDFTHISPNPFVGTPSSISSSPSAPTTSSKSAPVEPSPDSSAASIPISPHRTSKHPTISPASLNSPPISSSGWHHDCNVPPVPQGGHEPSRRQTPRHRRPLHRRPDHRDLLTPSGRSHIRRWRNHRSDRRLRPHSWPREHRARHQLLQRLPPPPVRRIRSTSPPRPTHCLAASDRPTRNSSDRTD